MTNKPDAQPNARCVVCGERLDWHSLGKLRLCKYDQDREVMADIRRLSERAERKQLERMLVDAEGNYVFRAP